MHRPRIRLTIRQRTRVLRRWPQAATSDRSGKGERKVGNESGRNTMNARDYFEHIVKPNYEEAKSTPMIFVVFGT
jgi:hypothetical protein